jgi:hypothetical protein
MADWFFGKKKKLTDKWPKTDGGELVRPAFLTHVGGTPMDMQIVLSLLEAYGIPAVDRYPNDGDFGRLILGHAGGGVDVYVPETMLDEAKDILNAEIVEDEAEASGDTVPEEDK